jgi:hypothetical protein
LPLQSEDIQTAEKLSKMKAGSQWIKFRRELSDFLGMD